MEAEAKADDTDSHGFQSDGVDAWHVPLKDGEASKQMLGVLGMVETALRDRGRGEEATEERERGGGNSSACELEAESKCLNKRGVRCCARGHA